MERPYEMYFLNQRENDRKIPEEQVLDYDTTIPSYSATDYEDIECNEINAHIDYPNTCKRGFKSEYDERLQNAGVDDGSSANTCTWKEYMT